jgi:hypothetical protein
MNLFASIHALGWECPLLRAKEQKEQLALQALVTDTSQTAGMKKRLETTEAPDRSTGSTITFVLLSGFLSNMQHRQSRHVIPRQRYLSQEGGRLS